MTLEIEPLSDESLLHEMHRARAHAEKVVARWRRSVDEEDPASHVWYDLAIQHGQMYLVLKALVDYRIDVLGSESFG